jgi:hypothetical protein
MRPKNPPIIRPGQRVPYHKASQREIDERRGFVARLLSRGVPKMKIHGLVKEKFGRQWRTTDRDITFVTGTNTSANTRLTRVRAEGNQSMVSEMMRNIEIIYGHNTK